MHRETNIRSRAKAGSWRVIGALAAAPPVYFLVRGISPEPAVAQVLSSLGRDG